jgi:hypothetical protein
MCGSLFKPDIPKIEKPELSEPEQQQTPQFGASNTELNQSKTLRSRRKGTSGFKIDIQTPSTSSGLNVGGN